MEKVQETVTNVMRPDIAILLTAFPMCKQIASLSHHSQAVDFASSAEVSGMASRNDVQKGDGDCEQAYKTIRRERI